MTELSPLQRKLRVYGIEAPLTVDITESGLMFGVQGTRKKVSVGWVQVIKACSTGPDAPSYLADKPYELLQMQAKLQQTRKTKREDKKVA